MNTIGPPPGERLALALVFVALVAFASTLIEACS